MKLDTLLKILGKLSLDSASTPGASLDCRTAGALLETGTHTEICLGLPAQGVRVGRKKCSRRFCLL